MPSLWCIRGYCTVHKPSAPPYSHSGLCLFLLMSNSSPIPRDEIFRDVVRGLDRMALSCKSIPWHGLSPIGRRPAVPKDLINNDFDFFLVE